LHRYQFAKNTRITGRKSRTSWKKGLFFFFFFFFSSLITEATIQGNPLALGSRSLIAAITDVLDLFYFRLHSHTLLPCDKLLILSAPLLFSCLPHSQFCMHFFQVEVFWAVTLCNVVVGYQRFGGPCCVYHQGEVSIS
jgi:hypothetical protein